jgi:proteasome lid subunit RPN8/RPN11
LPSSQSCSAGAITQLCIAARDLALIDAEARAGLPREACGLLIGRAQGDALIVSRVVPAANLAEAEDRFEIDPALLLEVHRSLRGSPERLIGHYHSHPGGLARPSAHDRAQSFTPGLAWLILGIAKDGALSRAAFLHPPEIPPPPPAFQPLTLVVRPAA